jgi:predicted aspartyl protease
MILRNCNTFALLVIFAAGLVSTSQYANGKTRLWLAEGPSLASKPAYFEIPLQVFATKIYVELEIGGKPRRFVFDTGSPSMIDAELAKELKLNVVGTNQGKDAHGVVITSDIVMTSVKLGNVSINKVPMYTAPFSDSLATKTFIGDGVLGSEVLKLGAWQVDLQNSVLRFSTDVSKLPNIAGARRSKLYNFGYPHTPIFDVQFAKTARSKAMFDTGSPAYFAISPADYAGVSKEGGIGRTISGYGSAGGSLGGEAPASDQLQVELKKFSLGEIEIGRVGAVQRTLSPSLIGAKMLEHYIVTLDTSSELAYFAQYNTKAFSQSSFGFTLSFTDGISVAIVWANSPAAAVGLKPGMALRSINGEAVETSAESLQRALAAMQAARIDIVWDEGSATLDQKQNILKD